MKKLFLSLLTITLICCTKHESTTGKKLWFSYEFALEKELTQKAISEDELNIESYYRGVYAERVRLNIEQKRDVSFQWKAAGLTYTVTAFLTGGTVSNERRTDPQPPPPPPQFRKK